MNQRAWHEVDWRKVAVLVAVPTLVLLVIPLGYLLVFQPPTVACIVEKNGEFIKAWGADCDGAKIRFVVK